MKVDRVSVEPGFLRRSLVAPDSDDASLMAAVAGGDDLAVARIYDRYAPVVYAVALRICGTPAVAEEIVSDTFLRAWKSARRYDPARAELLSWLVAIARNAALDQLRQRGARAPETGLTERLEAAPDDAEARVDARSALRGLPLQERSVLELAYFAGLPQREIARRLGLPLGTVKSLTRRGLEALRRGGTLTR